MMNAVVSMEFIALDKIISQIFSKWKSISNESLTFGELSRTYDKIHVYFLLSINNRRR